MNKKIIPCILFILFSLTLILTYIPRVQAQETGVAAAKMMFLYRIELMAKNRWKPVKETKNFKKNQTIRFRFLSNVAGTLYVLNNSSEKASLKPVFIKGMGADLRRFFGMGTYIDAGEVGVFPDPNEGGGLRFRGKTGKERFLFIFVPKEIEYARAMMAIPAGAENWKFDAKSTYRVTGEQDKILFHFFELKSK